MNYNLVDNILSDDIICDLHHELDKRTVLNEGKVGNRIDYNQKIRYDIFITKKELLKKLDRKIFDIINPKINDMFNVNLKYREMWKLGYYVGEKNGFYTYHKDTAGVTNYRKISFVISISDPNDYKGGELHFKELDVQVKLEKNQGVFFRSDILHGVKPVTEGNRLVLIGFLFDDEGYQLKTQNKTNPMSYYHPMLEDDKPTPVVEPPKKVLSNVDKDYNDNYDHPWSDSDNYWYEDNKSDTLIVTFAGFGSKGSIPTFVFYNFLKQYPNIDKLFLRDIKCNYYINGLKNETNTFEETLELYNSLINKKQYKKIIGLGCSSGGYACILYGHLLNFTKLLVFSPQTVINEEKVKIGDKRFINTCNYVCSRRQDENYKKLFDLKNMMPFNCEIELFYGERADNGMDKKHCERIESDIVRLNPQDSNAHIVVLEMRNNGKLKELLDNELLE